MKTTLRFAALAALLAAGAVAALRQSLPPSLVFRSPGQESTAPAGTGFAVRGRVTHEGIAVPGARVKAMSLRPPRRGVIITTPHTRQTVTDSDGRFDLADIAGGTTRLTVIADLFAPSAMTLEVGAATSQSEIAVALEPGVSMEARITAAGIPVEGAQVSVRRMGHDAHGEHRPLRTGTTGADGRFRLDALDPVGALRLVILAEGHRPFETTLRAPADLPPEIGLETGLQITGRIATADGTAVNDVEVSASQGEGYTAAGRSGESGDVRIGGLVWRPITLRISKDGYAPAKLELPSPSSGWTLVLRRTGGLAGRGPAGSWVAVEYDGSTYRRRMGADGTFRLDGLPPGPAEARAYDLAGHILASRKVDIPEGGVADGVILAP